MPRLASCTSLTLPSARRVTAPLPVAIVLEPAGAGPPVAVLLVAPVPPAVGCVVTAVGGCAPPPLALGLWLLLPPPFALGPWLLPFALGPEGWLLVVVPEWPVEVPPLAGLDADPEEAAGLGAGAGLDEEDEEDLELEAKELGVAKLNASAAPRANTRPGLSRKVSKFIEFSILELAAVFASRPMPQAIYRAGLPIVLGEVSSVGRYAEAASEFSRNVPKRPFAAD